jgi:hypothetical protein
MTENVFGVSRQCEILWQVERTDDTGMDPVNTYVGASRLEATPERVCLVNWNGIAVDVDVRSGRVLDMRIVK